MEKDDRVNRNARKRENVRKDKSFYEQCASCLHTFERVNARTPPGVSTGRDLNQTNVVSRSERPTKNSRLYLNQTKARLFHAESLLLTVPAGSVKDTGT